MVMLKQKSLDASPSQTNSGRSLLDLHLALQTCCREMLGVVPCLIGSIMTDGEVKYREDESKAVGILFFLLPMHAIRRCDFAKSEY